MSGEAVSIQVVARSGLNGVQQEQLDASAREWFWGWEKSEGGREGEYAAVLKGSVVGMVQVGEWCGGSGRAQQEPPAAWKDGHAGGEVMYLVVAEAYWGRGRALALIQEAEAHTRRLGWGWVLAESWQHSGRSSDVVFARAGWDTLNSVPAYWTGVEVSCRECGRRTPSCSCGMVLMGKRLGQTR